MPNSLNGWQVIPDRNDARLHTGTIPGTRIRITAHKDALPILLALAAEVHEKVHSLTDNNAQGQDEAGYTYRPARGSDAWSNHASGSAIDLNWRLWPMFLRRMTPVQRRRAKKVTARFDGILTWGGDWSRVDEMHWEISKGVSVMQARQWAKRHIGPDNRLTRSK